MTSETSSQKPNGGGLEPQAPATPHDPKRELRALMKRRRAEAAALRGPEAARRVAAHGLDFLRPRDGAVVSGFAAIGDEIDPGPLLHNLHREGFRLALPRMQGKGRPLVLHAWEPGDELIETTWGIREPATSAPEVHPDVVLVPLLAFDAAGYRLGYGGGFYDRTISGLRRLKPIVTVGIAYDEQKVDAVPHSDYDERLDWVLTPSGPLRVRNE